MHLPDELQRHKLRVLLWPRNRSYAWDYFFDLCHALGDVDDDDYDAEEEESELYFDIDWFQRISEGK